MPKKDDTKMMMDMSCEHEGDKAHKSCCGDGMCCMDGMGCGAGGCGCGAGGCAPSMYEHQGGKHGGKMLLALSASLFLLLSAVWVGMQVFGNPWYKNIRAEFTAAPYNRTVTVDGVGKISAKPDLARVSLSVVATGKTVKAVTEEGNKKMTAVIDQVKALGIKPEDIQTTGYYLNPEYDYNTPVVYDKAGMPVSKQPTILGYSLTQSIDVKVRELNKSDDVIDKATTAGANQVGSLSFELDDASNVKNQAREIAFKKAREKAEMMAKAAGVRLGNVVTFSEGSGGYPVPYANFVKAMDSSAGESTAPSIEAGTQELNISVSVTYEIE